LSFDPKIRFGLEKVPSIEEGEDFEATFGFQDFTILVENLRTEEDLDAKRKMVRDAALQADIDEWNHWYRPILLKTLHTSIPMNIIVSTLSELTKR